jgi:hypothetical protein
LFPEKRDRFLSGPRSEHHPGWVTRHEMDQREGNQGNSDQYRYRLNQSPGYI